MSTYYVSTTGNDTTGDGLSKAWASIKKALTTVAAGSTVIVGVGTFTETSTTVAHANVTLIGAGDTLTFLVLAGTGACIISAAGFSVTGMTIDGRADASTGWSIHADNIDGLTVTNCTLYGPEDGFLANNCNNVTLTNVDAISTYDGMNINGCTNVLIDGCSFVTDSSYNSGQVETRGITAQGTTGTIRNTTVSNIRTNTGGGNAANRMHGIDATGQLVLENVTVSVQATNAGYLANVIGVGDLNGPSGAKDVRLTNISISTSTAGTGTAYDIYAGVGLLTSISGNVYDSSKVFGIVQTSLTGSLSIPFFIPGTYNFTTLIGANTVQAIGAGGSGGTRTTGEGGGAGGDYASKQFAWAIGGVHTITVGDGAASTDGGSSYVDDGAILTASGGLRGSTSTAAGGSGGIETSVGDVVHHGGFGGAGNSTVGGGGGGSATALADGLTGSTADNGSAGGTGSGGGGNGGASGVSGIPGQFPGGGGGGGGAAGGNNGGGADGMVTLAYVLPLTSSIQDNQIIGLAVTLDATGAPLGGASINFQMTAGPSTDGYSPSSKTLAVTSDANGNLSAVLEMGATYNAWRTYGAVVEVVVPTSGTSFNLPEILGGAT